MLSYFTRIQYTLPENRFSEEDHCFGRTADGEFYARVQLHLHTDDPLASISFLLYVQLSEADWHALRDGTAKFVIGKVVEELPACFGEYQKFYPQQADHTVGYGHVSVAHDRLDDIFRALANPEAA